MNDFLKNGLCQYYYIPFDIVLIIQLVGSNVSVGLNVIFLNLKFPLELGFKNVIFNHCIILQGLKCPSVLDLVI